MWRDDYRNFQSLRRRSFILMYFEIQAIVHQITFSIQQKLPVVFQNIQNLELQFIHYVLDILPSQLQLISFSLSLSFFFNTQFHFKEKEGSRTFTRFLRVL